MATPVMSLQRPLSLRIFMPPVLAASAFLAGCTTPVETRNAVSELNRLCEAEAGYRVFRPDILKLDGSSTLVACPVSAPDSVCFAYGETTVLSTRAAEKVVETPRTSITRYRTSYVRLPDRLRLGERVSFLGQGKAPQLADSGTKQFACEPRQLKRKTLVSSEVGRGS